MDIIGKTHQVDWFLGGDVPDNNYDWIMPWGVCSLPFNQTIEKYSGKKALLCAGHPSDLVNIEKFDHIFVESPAVYREMLPFTKSISIAFGVDTELFKPNPDEPKIFDVLYIATWSEGWKRQSLFAESVKGLRACAAGSLQPDGIEGLKKCTENGVYTMVGLVPTRVVALLYQMSKVCVITSWHGSERSMLESLASNVPLIITKDNELGASLVEYHAEIVNPNPIKIRTSIDLQLKRQYMDERNWVLQKYSAQQYVHKILEVLEK